MARVDELDLAGFKILNRDFGGNKFGPQARQFSIEIEDPELQERLIRDGVKLSYSKYSVEGEPPKAYLNIRVDFRFNDVKIAAINNDGDVYIFDETDIHELDSEWIKNTEMHILLNSYDNHGRKGVTPYCKTLIVWTMSSEEKNAVMDEQKSRGDAVREKYSDIFNKR